MPGLTILLVGLALPWLSAQAQTTLTTCVYDGENANVQMGGEAVVLSVSPEARILVNGQECPQSEGSDDVAGPPADTGNTQAVIVSGTATDDEVTIEQNGEGGPFPSELSFAIALAEDLGDILRVAAGPDDDFISGDPGVLYLDANRSGAVSIPGVDQVEIDAGDGDDTIVAAAVPSAPLGVTVNEPDGGALQVPITIWGRGGADTLFGGAADDHLYGEEGDDHLDGQDGTDVLIGGPDIDVCWFTDQFLSCDPDVQLDPPRALGGARITAIGRGWYPENGSVSVGFDVAVAPAVTAQADATGAFVAELDVPPRGSSETVTACQRCGVEPVNEDSAPFEYAAAPELTLGITPERATGDDTVTAFGSGWFAGEQVFVFLDPRTEVGAEPVGVDTAGQDGRFEISFEVEVLSLGRHRVFACQRCDDEGALERRTSLVVVEGPPPLQPEPESWWSTTAGKGGTAAVLFALAVAAYLLLRQTRPPYWRPRVHAESADHPKVTSIDVVDDGTTDHVVRLVPSRDVGVQRIEEVSTS